MYNFGGSFGSSCGCGSFSTPSFAPYYPYGGCGSNNNSNYAIVLVLFILLVIVIGSRFAN